MRLKLALMEERQKAHQQWFIIIVGIIFSLAGGSLTLVLYQSRKRIRKKNQLLCLQNAQITNATREIQNQHEQIIAQAELLQQKNIFLEARNAELQELNREKDSLIGIVAHDLRSPINRTIGLAKILQGTTLNLEQQNLVRLLLQVNDEGIHLIKDILQASADRLETTTLQQLSLYEFIHETVAKLHRDCANRKNIDLRIAVDKQLEVETDPTSLRRILDNLISNAIKFSEPGTAVSIKVMSTDDAVFISVIDQGPGISPSDQQKMFKKFQRLSAQPTGGETSTGLGLAIVKNLVGRLNGELKVESEPGMGTEFILRLRKTFTSVGSASSIVPIEAERAIL